MKFYLLPALAIVSCAPVSPVPNSASGMVVYRYVNTLDFGNNNSMDAIAVTGYDDRAQKEATRLDVSVGAATISLRDPYDGTDGGAMYNPSVELTKDGALAVSWEQIGEVHCRSEIVAGEFDKLVERKRVSK